MKNFDLSLIAGTVLAVREQNARMLLWVSTDPASPGQFAQGTLNRAGRVEVIGDMWSLRDGETFEDVLDDLAIEVA